MSKACSFCVSILFIKLSGVLKKTIRPVLFYLFIHFFLWWG